MRRRVVALLQEHPEGLSPAQTRRLLSVDKDLGSTMKAMARDGLLQRVETGRYVVGD
jgi:predicted transcriptional regulator of viral defense system